jgi:hypothetical protein
MVNPLDYITAQQSRRDEQIRNVINMFLAMKEHKYKQAQMEIENEREQKKMELEEKRAQAYEKIATRQAQEPDWLTKQAVQQSYNEAKATAKSKADADKADRDLATWYKKWNYTHAKTPPKQLPADTRHLDMVKEIRTRIQQERQDMSKPGNPSSNAFAGLSLDQIEQQLKDAEIIAANNQGRLPAELKPKIENYYRMTQSDLLKSAQGETAAQNFEGLKNLVAPTNKLPKKKTIFTGENAGIWEYNGKDPITGKDTYKRVVTWPSKK